MAFEQSTWPLKRVTDKAFAQLWLILGSTLFPGSSQGTLSNFALPRPKETQGDSHSALRCEQIPSGYLRNSSLWAGAIRNDDLGLQNPDRLFPDSSSQGSVVNRACTNRTSSQHPLACWLCLSRGTHLMSCVYLWTVGGDYITDPLASQRRLFFFLILFVYFWLLCLHCRVWAFSSCGVQASCCGGFSGGGAWPLGCPGSAVVTLGCSEACGIFPYRGSNPCSSRWAGGLPSTYHQGSPRLLRAASDVTLSQLLVKTPAKSLKGVTLKWKQWSKLSGSKADTGCWRKMWKQAFFVLWWWWWVSNTEIFLQSFPLLSSCQSV